MIAVAVSIAVYSVVVRNATIESRFRGGMMAYQAACPNQSWCTDGRVSRIGFMSFEDVRAFVQVLERSGIRKSEIAVTRQGHGLLLPCGWLETGVFEGRSIAWLAGTEPETVFIPECDMLTPQAQRLSREELAATHKSLGEIDGVERYRHRVTGEMVYVGRPALPPPARRRWRWPFGH